MAEEERISTLLEKDDTDTSRSKDTYVPEEQTSDISISLIDIQMPETPDSTKGQTSDGDTSRLESPKTIKPVLGKIQAKKRLMAFANQFKALSKSQIKPNLSQHSTLKIKDKTIQDDANINKSRKKTEEKILAIEEIRREESKSKMLLAEAMAAASMEDENYTSRNVPGLFESTKRTKEKNKHRGINDNSKNKLIDRKYSERHRHRDRIDKDKNLSQDVKDRNESIERFTQKSSQDRDKNRKKDKKKKDDKDKRDNSKITPIRYKKEEGKDKKENEKEKEKQVETKEKTGTAKNKKENIKEKQTDMLEVEVDGKDKKEKDKDKWKDKVALKSSSWAEVRKSGLTFDDIIHIRRRDNSERSNVKVRTTQQDYTRHLEQMLMLNNHRLKRQALIAEGLEGPKKYPPESIKLTKRTRGLQLSYCENPRISLLLNISQLLQTVTPERREKIREICEASLPQIDTEDTMQQKRNWYHEINTIKSPKDSKWQTTIQLPKSKWDSEDEELSSINVAKKEVEKPINKLQVSINEQGCSATSDLTNKDTINNPENIKEDNKSCEKIIENIITNDEASTSSSQSAGNEKLASEYEQFMKMVCTTSTDVTKEYSPKKNPVKSTSPHSYHEFDIESNLAEDSITLELPLTETFDRRDKQTFEGSIKSTECEGSILSTDCQIQINENIQIEHTSENNESEDSKSIPSDWENVRIKVERLSDENTESKEIKKKKKKRKIISSSDSSSSTTSSDSEKEKKKRKRKRKRKLSISSSSDSDSIDSSSTSSSDTSSSEERRKRKRKKKKKIEKKRKKAKRIARIRKKRRRKMSTDSNSDSDEHVKKRKKMKKKPKEVKSINNGDISKIISKSPIITSSADGAKILQSVTSVKKITEEAADENRKRSDQIASTKKTIVDVSIHDHDCLKQKKERKETKPDESFMEQWEMDSVSQQIDDDISSQDHIRESKKADDLEKNKYRKKRKHSRDNLEQEEDQSSKTNEENIHEGKTRSDEEVETKKKKRKEKDIKNSTEFLANWEREGERITQQINEAKHLKKLGKQKKEKWGETDFDTLNVPSLTQLEKEVCQKQLLADEWEVDSLEAISDLIMNKRKTNQSSLKKIEKEVRYDKKTDTYIAIEKESVREMKKKQERLCAIRIWEEEQEEGEREEMMLLEQKSKQRKTDDWDIEEESLFRKNPEEMEVCKINDIVAIEKEWGKTDEEKDIEETANKLPMKSSKRVKKSRWDMGSQSEEKPEVKDIWEEEYAEWSKINKCEQELEKTRKDEICSTDFYHKKPQSRESLERSWASEEATTGPAQLKKDSSVAHLISTKANEEQLASTKERQTRDQFKEILESDIKFQKKTLDLYSPSSPALSQKSQDVEGSSGSNSYNSLLCEKNKTETSDELLIPITGIPLQLTKLRDTKHAANEKIDDILNKVHLEDKDSVHSFDVTATDNLFDDISINESCSKLHTSENMDIFAEYKSEKSCGKQHAVNSIERPVTHTNDDEVNEEKNSLKLIPKQFLIRRTNEQVKSKRVLETSLQSPAQHAAALLTIQKKLLESHALKNDNDEYTTDEQADHFTHKYSIASNSGIDSTLLDTTNFSVVSKSSVITIRQSKSPTSEKAVSIRSEQSDSYDRESKNNDIKRYKANRNVSDTDASLDVQSLIREHRKRSPGKKDNEKYSHDKDRKEKKTDDAEKFDRRDMKGSKDFADRRRSSPSGRGKKRRSRSPYVSWEQQRSRSGSPGHSWSRSRSKSPKRKDEASTSTRDRDKKRERYDDERSGKSRSDERKERYTRSPPPPRFGYNEDNFKKYGPSKHNRDDWSRRKHDNVDRDHEKDTRMYDPMEILRERTVESEKYRDNRFHTEELDHTFWQYENSCVLRDGNESIDSYTVGQDLPLEYDDRTYYREGSLDRDTVQSSPQSQSKYKKRFNTRRERQWEKDKDHTDLDRHGHLRPRLRNRTPPRLRYSPMRQVSERFRRKSRSRSRSWSPLRSRTRSRSRSDSRSRSASRSRFRMRSQSRSRSRSPFDMRLKDKSASMSRLRSPEQFRTSAVRSSRSPSLGRDRLNEIERERNDDDENKKFNDCSERGRRIETIVQTGVIPGTNILDSEMNINSVDTAAPNFQYSNEIEGGNEYYYTENNLTYPPCMDESSTSSPKRLSLDDRLELELGIKKQQKDSVIASEYSSNFNSNVITYSSPPPQQPQQMMYRQQPTVVQVGNVLQVVPADFNGVQSARREMSVSAATPPVRSGSSQVVRVGNVLQVVPTSVDWSNSSKSNNSNSGGSSNQSSSTTDQSSGVLYSSTVPAPSPSTSSISMSVPIPVPVPLPVPPALPAAANTHAPVANIPSATPLPLSLPIPVPVPVPIPAATVTSFSRNEVQKSCITEVVQPVYNYEAILETRRKEREERKRLRELRRKEKERRRIERVNRRALRLLEKNNTSRQASGVLLDQRKGAIVDPSVLKALKEGDEQAESPPVNPVKEEEALTSIKEEYEDAAVDEDDDDDDDEGEAEAEADDDDEEEEEAEDEDEDDDDEKLQAINQRIEIDETMTTFSDTNKDQANIEIKREWPELPPPPLKGILVVPGFRRDTIPNGNLNDPDADDSIKEDSDKDEEIDKNNEYDEDVGLDTKSSKLKLNKIKRNKKSVQFADGIKPGEGTSPSGGEGDMPSPPPPKGTGFRDGLGDLRKNKIYSSRKSRKQEKRVRSPKTKKKVKVKIIKLKKPRITPLTAMMMDDSDEMDDRSPPPPPPGSPPPPHLWPSYLSIYNTTVRAIEQSQSTTTSLASLQAPPPPTPLPLLIPPPPLNYTIQPCSKS
ncbi:trichohyalin isoform X2 [Cardiocondyla obscurior]|uniref:trichohyalin isoform X2 n=1 Tax=Cardiocondyla obscurior TaxID=286306 RepID=UPI003965723E